MTPWNCTRTSNQRSAGAVAYSLHNEHGNNFYRAVEPEALIAKLKKKSVEQIKKLKIDPRYNGTSVA